MNTVLLAAGVSGFVIGQATRTKYDKLFDRVWGGEAAAAKAIITKESNWNERAVADEPGGSKSYGLFQINSNNFSALGVARGADLFDPEVSIVVAKKLWDMNKRSSSVKTIWEQFSVWNTGVPVRRRRSGAFVNQVYVVEVGVFWVWFLTGELFRFK